MQSLMTQFYRLQNNIIKEISIPLAGLQSPAFSGQLSVMSRLYANPLKNKTVQRIDISFGFLELTLGSVVHLVIHAVSTTFGAILTLFSREYRPFVEIHYRRCWVALNSLKIGLVGIVAPNLAHKMIWKDAERLALEILAISIAEAVVETNQNPTIKNVFNYYGVTDREIEALKPAIRASNNEKIRNIVKASLFVNANFIAHTQFMLSLIGVSQIEIQKIHEKLQKGHIDEAMKAVYAQGQSINMDKVKASCQPIFKQLSQLP